MIGDLQYPLTGPEYEAIFKKGFGPLDLGMPLDGTGTDWPNDLTGHAPTDFDPDDDTLRVVAEPDGVSDVKGRVTPWLWVPNGSSQLTLGLYGRASTAPAGADVTVKHDLYIQEAGGSWGAAKALPDITVPDGGGDSYATQGLLITHADSGLSTQAWARLLIVRDVAGGGDDLVGNWIYTHIVPSFA